MNCRFCDIEINGQGGCTTHEKSCGKNPASAHRDDLVFVENSTFPRHNIKRRILNYNMIPYICIICGLGPKKSNRLKESYAERPLSPS